MRIFKTFAAAAATGCAILASGGAMAQDYPTETIEWVVPSSAGSGFDVMARIITPKLSEVLGQPVVVQTIPGAGGTIGATTVAEAEPDGYTILHANINHTSAEALYSDLTYSLLDSFDPVVRFVISHHVFVVHPSVEAETLEEFIALAKENPGELNWGSAGIGSSTFMGGAMFMSMAGIDVAHIPYDGGGPAVAAVVAGEVQFYAAPYATAKPFIEEGQLRALAVSSAERASFLPDLPGAVETLPDYNFVNWYGLLVPKGTPLEVRETIRAAVNETLADPDIKAQISDLGFEIIDEGPDEFGDFLANEIAVLKEVVEESGIEVQ